MFPKITVLVLSTLSASVLAVPTPIHKVTQHRVEDVRCHCLSYSTSAKPSVCTYLDSHALDWDSAYSLASSNDLKLQFVSQSTISKVLAIPNPLPTSMLQSLSQGEAKAPGPSDLLHSENKIVCGLGDEVMRLGKADVSRLLEVECHYIASAISACVLFVIVYCIVRAAFIRIFDTQDGAIKLEGDEKTLLASMEQDHAESNPPPANFS